MQFLKSPYITAPFYSFPLLCCTVQYMHLLQCGRSRMFIPFPGSDFLPSQITDRVGNGISFRKNSAEKTRNDFRYSAEESIHSEAFRVPRKSQFRSSERSGTEWNSAEKNSFTEQQQSNLTKWFVCTSKVVFSDTIFKILACRVLFRVGFSSTEWFGTEFREFASILVPRNGIPSCITHTSIPPPPPPPPIFQPEGYKEMSSILAYQ